MSSFWSPENLEIAKSMALHGCSLSRIADELGCTRNMVLGKLRRLGYYCNSRHGNKNYRNNLVPIPVIKKVTAPPPPPPPKPEPKPLIPRSTIRAVGFGECRWPIGEASATMKVCGDVVSSGSAYCEEHRRESKAGARAKRSGWGPGF